MRSRRTLPAHGALQSNVRCDCPAAAFPLHFIPDTAKRYLYARDANGQRHVLLDRYEFLVYRLLRNGVEAGDVFCRDSVRFRSFEDDLIDDHRWKDKGNLIADMGLPLLKQPIREHLAELETQLEDRLIQVNQRIASGDNAHFAIKKHGLQTRWTLQYPRSAELINPHSTEFSGGARRYSQYPSHFNTLLSPCLICTHHRRQGDETWHRPPKRHAKTVPSPSISRTHPPTSS